MRIWESDHQKEAIWSYIKFSTYSKGKSMEIGQENLYVDIRGFKG